MIQPSFSAHSLRRGDGRSEEKLGGADTTYDLDAQPCGATRPSAGRRQFPTGAKSPHPSPNLALGALLSPVKYFAPGENSRGPMALMPLQTGTFSGENGGAVSALPGAPADHDATNQLCETAKTGSPNGRARDTSDRVSPSKTRLHNALAIRSFVNAAARDAVAKMGEEARGGAADDDGTPGAGSTADGEVGFPEGFFDRRTSWQHAEEFKRGAVHQRSRAASGAVSAGSADDFDPNDSSDLLVIGTGDGRGKGGHTYHASSVRSLRKDAESLDLMAAPATNWQQAEKRVPTERRVNASNLHDAITGKSAVLMPTSVPIKQSAQQNIPNTSVQKRGGNYGHFCERGPHRKGNGGSQAIDKAGAERGVTGVLSVLPRQDESHGASGPQQSVVVPRIAAAVNANLSSKILAAGFHRNKRGAGPGTT